MASFLGSLWPSRSTSRDTASTADHADTGDKELPRRIFKDGDVQVNIDGAHRDQSTPKAQPQIVGTSVPTFELSEHVSDSQELVQPPYHASQQTAGVPTSPQATMEASASQGPSTSPQSGLSTSPQVLRAGISPRSTQTTSVSSSRAPQSLMPPSTNDRTALSAPSKPSLMPPPRGPLPDRGPPGNSQQRVGSSSRGKVLLSPGHSPMDWASLTRSNNLSGVPAFQRITPSQLKVMNGRKGKAIWSSYQGKVYNITPYLPFHPGGERELYKSAGRDGTKLFMDIHPWVNWEGMLSACLVGILVSDEAEGTLEDID